MINKNSEKYFFFGLLIINFILAFFIFKPFWIVLVLGISFTIVLFPVFRFFEKSKMPAWLASLITVLIFIILICGPMYGIGTIIFNQSQDFYSSLGNNRSITPFTEAINNSINSVLPDSFQFDINEKIADLLELVSSNITKIFSTTITAILSFFLMLLVIFYLLKDGQEWKEVLVKLSPLKDSDDYKILENVVKTVNGVIKGYLFIALIQGLLMGIGLTIFGVPNAALWGLVAGITSMVPSIGTGFVSIPAIIYLYTTGNILPVIGMAAWAVLIVGLVDNFLNPIIISKNIKVPMLLILFSVLGGLSLLGPVGILIGPLVISLLFTLVSIYKENFQVD